MNGSISIVVMTRVSTVKYVRRVRDETSIIQFYRTQQ